jgi:hypothetical protein
VPSPNGPWPAGSALVMKPGAIIPPINTEKLSVTTRRTPNAIKSLRVVLSSSTPSEAGRIRGATTHVHSSTESRTFIHEG